jgi:hypothetical protein
MVDQIGAVMQGLSSCLSIFPAVSRKVRKYVLVVGLKVRSRMTISRIWSSLGQVMV